MGTWRAATLALVLGTWTAGAAQARAELPVVQGNSLRKKVDLEPWIDRTFILEDRFARTAPTESMPDSLRSIGFNDTEHLGFFLADSSLTVFVARTEVNEDFLRGLREGDRVSITGVLRSERYRRPDVTEMVGDLDITVSWKARITQAVDARSVKRGWAGDAPFLLEAPREADYPAVEGTAVPAPGARARIRVPVAAARFSRAFTVPESAAGLSLRNAVKVTWGAGAAASGERRLEVLDPLTSAEDGDVYELWLRSLPGGKDSKGPPVVVLDRVRVLARKP